jgi:integrase
VTALTAARRLVDYDPLRDKSYQDTALGRDVVDFLAWLELGGCSPRTLMQYEHDLSRGALLFPSKGMSDLEDGDALQIARLFKSGERRVRVAAWRSFFKWGLRSRRITVNPFDALPAIKQAPRRVYDLFTDPEIQALCALPVRDGALMRFLFDTGARKGDCRMFQLHHWRTSETIDAPYGSVVFMEGKGGKDRQVPLTQALSMALGSLSIQEGLGRTDHLWYSVQANAVRSKVVRTKPCGEGTFHRWWGRCLEEAEVRYRNPHMTRHTFATRFLRGLTEGRQGRLETLAILLGHESVATTSNLYGHLDMRDAALDMGLIGVVE